MVYTLSGAQQTITLPPYASYTGTSTIPTNSPAGTMLTVQISTNNFDSVPIPSGETADFFSSLELSQQTTFGDGSPNYRIPVTLNSPCILTTRTYHVYEYAFGAQAYPNSTNANGAQQNIMPTTAGTSTAYIVVTNNPFFANVKADVIVTHDTGT